MASAPPTATRLALDNLPLPRELRDHVYKYLLQADHVDFEAKHPNDKDWWRFMRPYSLSTNILLVNSTIGREAREVLYGSNKFITLSIKSDQLLGELIRMECPAFWITTDELLQFCHANMHLNLTHVGDVLPCENTCHMIVLVRDLPFLCLVLRSFLYTLRPAVESDAYQHGNHPWVGSIGHVIVKLTLKNSEYTMRSSQRDTALLQHFRDCISDNWKVQIQHFKRDQAFATALVSRMVAKHSSPTAMAWHILEALRQTMTLSDEAYQRGDLMHALNTLLQIIDSKLLKCIDYRVGSRLRTSFSTKHNPVARRIEVIIMDCMASATFLWLKIGYVNAAGGVVLHETQLCLLKYKALDFDEILPSSPDPVYSHLYIEEERCRVAVNLLGHRTYAPTSGSNIYAAIDRLDALLQIAPTYAPIKQDLRCLTALWKSDEVSSVKARTCLKIC